MMKYTLEHYQTGKIQVIEIPAKFFNINLKEIFYILDRYSCTFELNCVELIFLIIFHLEGWIMHRLPFNKSNPVIKYATRILYDEFNIKVESLFGKGCPDFLLTNKEDKKFRFVEIKHSENSLSSHQVNWIKKYNCDVFIAKLAPLHDKNGEYLSNKNVRGVNKLKI